MTTAFVLSGGASLGAAQAGMLQALYERDIRPDLLVGTSVGAINAAFAASRPPSVATAVELQRLWRRLGRTHVFPTNPITVGLGFLGALDHAVPVRPLRQLLQRHLQIDRLEDGDVGLHVVAADVLSGADTLLSSGPALEAVLASAALPGIFPPVPWQGRLLMDAGLINNTPISHAVALGADRLVVLPTVGRASLPDAPRGALAAAASAVAQAMARQFDEDVARFGDRVELAVLPAPCSAGIVPTDFRRADELIDEARRRGRALLARRFPRTVLRPAA